jgi:pyruvate dehydrogenase E2 component (dihydrolipoamide acetyltransferase)
MATGTAVDVVMPQMGVSVSEGTITKWLKSEGETVAADEGLLEISTDKVDTEVPSPATGVVQQILAQEGETVAVGTKIAVIAPEGAPAEAPESAPPEPATAQAAQEASVGAGAEGETAAQARAEEPPQPETAAEPEADAEPEAAPEPEAAAPPEPAQAPEPEPVAEAAAPPEPAQAPEPEREPVAEAAAPPEPAQAPEAEAAPTAPPAEDGDGRREAKFVSPVVARIASEHGVDVSQLEGTGRGGRVTKKDILAFVEGGAPAAPAPEAEPREEAPPAAPAAPAAPAPAPEVAAPKPAPAPAPTAAAPAAPAGAGEHVEPMSAMRKGIAEHMRRSLDTSAHVTTTFEVDLSKVVGIREQLKREYEQKHGVKLTYLAFIARATIDAIQKWPWMNAELRGESIVVKNYVNLGIAVALEGGKGLIVPVIKNAEGLNLLGLARSIADVAERARNKKLVPDDVQGGTFTITNPGGFGAIHGTPIISQPQVAILDVEAMVKRPVVISDESGADVIAIRPMMNLCLSYDHRLVDGAYAAQFMRDLKANLQTWDESAY